MNKSIFTIFVLLLCIVMQGNARTISDFFIDEPGHILPLLDKRVKMDMIDYENEGIKKEFNNAFGEGSHITSMSDSHISVKVSNSSSVEMLLIPCKKDSVILTISTFAIPAKDSRVECFNTSWGKIDSKKYFKAPTMNDFIVIPKGDKTKKKTILEAIEFPIIYYSLNNDGTITARHSLKEYMSKEDFDKIAPYLKDEIIVNIKK